MLVIRVPFRVEVRVILLVKGIDFVRIDLRLAGDNPEIIKQLRGGVEINLVHGGSPLFIVHRTEVILVL